MFKEGFNLAHERAHQLEANDLRPEIEMPTWAYIIVIVTVAVTAMSVHAFPTDTMISRFPSAHGMYR